MTSSLFATAALMNLSLGNVALGVGCLFGAVAVLAFDLIATLAKGR